ncbi:hypothetical protein IC232_01365 [Microvirga sp. BT688]|uniref:hypothetical protein n=1 Tax=Microvirga sp. TaxID=1873136 RepID=UPI001687BB24|nr:hypothetical protein [Microvirga sp.]MBD2745331.1 hypothetical protein [Microvirga sp.]
MGAPIQRLWHHISHWPFSSALHARDLNSEPPEAPDDIALETVAVTFKECDGICEPTAEQMEAQDRERTERFKRDQLLPIIGFTGGGPPS